MSQPHPDSEQALENATIALFANLGWETINCYQEVCGINSTLGRETRSEVVLVPRLRSTLEKLNPDLPQVAIALAIDELTRDRSTLSLANANREIYQLLKTGVKVSFKTDDDEDIEVTVKVIDWNTPDNNDFLLASQFSVTGEIYTRRADLIGFVNGLPLVFIELKAHHQRLELAYKKNLTDYKSSIPQLFWYNAFIILSNGRKSRISSLTAQWEHFCEWKKINSEGEEGIISLETMIRGTCDRTRLLDISENFIFFYEAKGRSIKVVAKNHQFLGVNSAVSAVTKIRQNQGKLGVFWHTQGSGKSYSMVFFSQKVLRKLLGNWTFLIITDREDLDDQIYKNFAYAGAVTEPEKEVRANNAEHLKQMLQEDHRYIFTLIQKFRTEKGNIYPKLSDRSDIIVIADEAHRSQYDTFALNLRNTLPNAGFIGFTGTPLMAGEEKTRAEFGDYISIYNFRQSIEDGATVPLYYENRIPELQLANVDLNEEVYQIIETATLDEEQENKLQREFSREYHLITRGDRQDKIAEDIVNHFLSRGYQGKAMVIAIDRFSALRMYDKVQHYWQQYLKNLKAQLPNCSESEQQRIDTQIAYMEATDMAVVISSAQNEIEDFKKKGLDIKPHRQRMAHESPGLDEKFKDENNPLRIVFVCAMWITGFDVPSCSTIYLDKPMQNHTLMQTIARANRVFKDKVNGLIVDYIGVFRNLQKALAVYGSASGGGVQEGDTPVKAKTALVEQLSEAIAEATDFCIAKGIDLSKLRLTQDAFARTKVWADAVEAILVNDDSKRTYFSLAGNITRLYKAILPDPNANEFSAAEALFSRLTQEIRSEIPDVDISEVKAQVEALLDESIVAGKFIIPDSQGQYIDLSQLDFEALKAKFTTGYQRTEAEKLKSTIDRKLQGMVRLNKSRANYLEKFQQMIADYNTGSRNVELFFNDLIAFAQDLDVEDKRAIAENLTEEELAIFDLLTKPEVNLTKQEEREVKQVARELLDTLKREKLVLDWRKRQQSRAAVRLAIEETLDQLPQSYSTEVYEQKCEQIYKHIYDSYQERGRSIYTSVA
ncbi:type I restriction endonuclease subunit R [Gloeocapsopsis dulcis]|uniref:Type I restriction enzyme endonuclease subunit n=1 Tax=Gloeocapsopsis dulcis AAB1 = 1H9 TaxID=1433147 RepID=A0A6N8FVZ7_9CHRO|nr:type I restriction endonuclease subunit R [Gloeocapsopsis dulcis]MUL36772.1 DEAD/DEAH box helicase [Gloeocapsopsis dulcis AAB1 = 1H9]WNN88620.1 type I restriction endonuclease subunit R [Gloeocapsopsis dulcis]